MTRIEENIYELCDEIDYLKAECAKWKKMYIEERDARTAETNESLERAKKGVGQALMLALSISDNDDGSLSISKENRTALAESFK